jgi:branched-chain amino acid aminotransferase group I
MDNIVYLNGDFINSAEATVPLMDYGFLYGYGLFETMRAYEGKIFRLDDHLCRLAEAADTLGISINIGEVSEAITKVLRVNQLREARVRLTVSRGAGPMTPNPTACATPTVAVTAAPYEPLPEAAYQRGFHAIVSTMQRNSGSPLTGLKTANYLGNLLAREAARAAGADDAILLNERGELAEASASNLFLVTDGVLQTPPVEAGILPGITRAVVMELASGLDISARESTLSLEELYRADEAFLTNSIMEIMPLTQVEGKMVGNGMPGPVTVRLMAAYKETVRRAR